MKPEEDIIMRDEMAPDKSHNLVGDKKEIKKQRGRPKIVKPNDPSQPR